MSDITERLENKTRDMWDLVQAEVKSERDHQEHVADVAHERRVSDHETLEAHFARLNSVINDRFIEFDDRIFRMNESRAGSITVQLQETIRTIKRYPDALHEIRSPMPRRVSVRYNRHAREGTLTSAPTISSPVLLPRARMSPLQRLPSPPRVQGGLTARRPRLRILIGAGRNPQALTAPRSEDFASACVASFDVACPSVVRKTVSFGETRMIESSFPGPSFGPRERNLNYSWPE